MSGNARAARSWASKADTQHLECRVGRHRFPGYTDLGTGKNITLDYNRKDGVYELVLDCERCGTSVRKIVTKGTGEISESGRYTHPDGYLFQDGTGYRMDKEGLGQVRLELISRALESKGPRR